MVTKPLIVVAATVAVLAAHASGSVQLLSQERTAKAVTSFNDAQAVASAPDFAPFVGTATTSVPFPLPGGGTGINSATTTINCLANPNKMRASGTMAGTGGTAQIGDVLQPVTAEAKTTLIVTFRLTTPTPYRLTARPRPDSDPNDSLEIELKNLDTSVELVDIPDTAAPQTIIRSGTLAPGRYSIKYKVEFIARVDMLEGAYAFAFDLGAACNPADVAGLGGSEGADNQLTADDLLVFLAAFFAGDLNTADIASVGGVSAVDGLLTADDVVGFLSAFFAGCG